jgi:hypothetical protein
VTTSKLLRLYSLVIKELRSRKVIRSSNNPVADYAENLVSKGLDLTLATKSTKGYDAIGKDGTSYEVKARRLMKGGSGSRQLSVSRDLETKHFDYLAGVLFNEDFSIYKACPIPYDVVLKLSEYWKYVSGWGLHLRDGLWNEKGVMDITKKIVEVQEACDIVRRSSK